MTRIRSTLRLGAVTAATTLALLAPPAHAADPGTPVAPVPQLAQSTNGGTNPTVGDVPATEELGRPDPGVVPVVGDAAARADSGARVLYESQVDDRIVDLMISSPALGGSSPVRLLLPEDFDRSSGRTWPVLYLLPGASERADYQSWSIYTDVLSWLGEEDVVVAMPSLGATGLGTNWHNSGRGARGGFQWDDYLSDELPQLLERGYAAADRRSVAGVSTGGFSAFALVAHNPGRYGAAASFSGLNALGASYPLVQALLLREGVSPTAPWGSRWLNYRQWEQADPSNHASALRQSRLFLSNGNGRKSPLDPTAADWDAFEASTLANNTALVSGMTLRGVTLRTDFYGDGSHSWPYWARSLERAWPELSAGLGR